MKTLPLALAASALCLAGCIQVKTESEIKPIHITMDVNLKVDKDLDKAFADENAPAAKGDRRQARALIDRAAAGVTNRAMLEERPGASDEDRILIAEENARRMKRFSEIAKSNNTTLATVQQRHAARMREKLPAGAWYQDEAGNWLQKK